MDASSDGHSLTSDPHPVASSSRLDPLDNEAPPPPSSSSTEPLPSLAQILQDTVNSLGGSTSNHGLQERKSARNGATTTTTTTALPSLPTLTSPASRSYISSLLSKDLPSLLREPEELARQSELLDADLANLCYRSTGELLGVGECVDGVEDGFGQMQSTLDSLLACTEELSTSCASFTASIEPILASRTRLSLVRSHVSSIEDILSIPRLVSTCVRGGWWSEAMELAYRARDLEKILKPHPPSTGKTGATSRSRRNLLGKVREEVEVEIKTLRARMLEGLRGRTLKLPAAVRSITLLRRMSTSALSEGETTHSLTEPELRLAFLTSRWECLRSQLDQLEVSAGSGASNEDRLKYVKRWIEVWREVVGETVTMHNEIFLVSQSHFAAAADLLLRTPASKPTKPATSTTNGSHNKSTSPLRLEDPQIPLTLFLSQAFTSLQSLLQQQLPNITSIASLSSLQTQLSYCSTAFTKFGFDFRSLPNRLITERVLDVLKDRFTQATEVLGRDIARALSSSSSRGGRPQVIFDALIATEARSSVLGLQESDITVERGGKVTPQPPSFISLFPPLAKHLNAHAMALNELRLLPLLSLYNPIRKAQSDTLLVSSQELENFARTAKTSVEETEQRSPHVSEDSKETRAEARRAEDLVILKHLILIYARCVAPWCRWALNEGVYAEVTQQSRVSNRSDLGSEEERLQEALDALLDVVGISRSGTGQQETVEADPSDGKLELLVPQASREDVEDTEVAMKPDETTTSPNGQTSGTEASTGNDVTTANNDRGTPDNGTEPARENQGDGSGPTAAEAANETEGSEDATISAAKDPDASDVVNNNE